MPSPYRLSDEAVLKHQLQWAERYRHPVSPLSEIALLTASLGGREGRFRILSLTVAFDWIAFILLIKFPIALESLDWFETEIGDTGKEVSARMEFCGAFFVSIVRMAAKWAMKSFGKGRYRHGASSERAVDGNYRCRRLYVSCITSILIVKC